MTACNNIENQNPDLENRFTLGKQFYDLERAACRGENIYMYICIHTYTYMYVHTDTHTYIHINTKESNNDSVTETTF